MKWIKANERRPDPSNDILYICRDIKNHSIVKVLRWENVPVCFEWLDESPESPSPSLQEAAEAYAVERSFPEDHPKFNQGKYEQMYNAFVAGWNAREAQQTGPLLLTRELHDKIWEGAISWKMEQIIISEFSEAPIPPEKNPDKETFYKSLNL